MDELDETLQAALGDERAGEALLSGRLSKPLRSGGLGGLDVEVGDAPDRPPERRPPRQSDKEAEVKKATAELDRTRRERMAAEHELARLERQVTRLTEQLVQVRNEVGGARERLRRARGEEQVAQRRKPTM